MHEHEQHSEHPHRWSLSTVIHVVGAAGEFWSSDLNEAVVDLADPQPGMTILDVGAGLGPATVDAAQRVGPEGFVIAVDPSAATRAVLRARRLWQRSREVIIIRPGSAESIPVPTGTVDRAISVNAAHHYEDTQLAASELARVLKPNGRLLLVDEDFTNPEHPYQHTAHAFEPDPVDAIGIAGLLNDAGLTATHVDNESIAGLTATIITAVAPAQHRPPTSQVNESGTGESP